jgi:hypothetical protein
MFRSLVDINSVFGLIIWRMIIIIDKIGVGTFRQLTTSLSILKCTCFPPLLLELNYGSFGTLRTSGPKISNLEKKFQKSNF